MKMKNVYSVVTLPTHVINALAPWTHTSTLAAQARLYFPCIIEDPLVFEKKKKNRLPATYGESTSALIMETF